MGRVAAGLPAGVRVSDHVTLGVIAQAFPLEQVHQVLRETGKASVRERDLPAQVMVYYVIALALFMGTSLREVLRCLLEGLRVLWGAGVVKVAGKSGLSQARTRLGEAPLRQLYEQRVQPIATRATRGAWYRGWHLVSLDGSCLDVADTPANQAGFGRPGSRRGARAYPQLRFVALVENGTHVLFGAQLGRYSESETSLAASAVAALRPGFLCLADRAFFGYALWRAAAATGAALLWRVKTGLVLARERALADGSFLSTIYPTPQHRKRGVDGIRVRVVEYQLHGTLARSRGIGCSARSSTLKRRRQRSWRRCITSAGKSRARWMRSRPTCAAHGWCCAPRHPPWCARSSGVCCWHISPFAG
jgi:hypothetical protein